jgi:hypothetical protein
MVISNVLSPFGIFGVHFIYFMVIWYIFPVLVSCTMKNLATPAAYSKIAIIT